MRFDVIAGAVIIALAIVAAALILRPGRYVPTQFPGGVFILDTHTGKMKAPGS